MLDATGPVQEIAELRALLTEREAELTAAALRIEQYRAQLGKRRRMQFGRSSEKLDGQIGQLELLLEDLEEGDAARTAPVGKHEPDQHHMSIAVKVAVVCAVPRFIGAKGLPTFRAQSKRWRSRAPHTRGSAFDGRGRTPSSLVPRRS